MAKNIKMFHGQECPHCRAMRPIVDKLIAEGYNIEKFEVWHNEASEKEMRKFEKIITESCGGDLAVPCFLDEKGKRAHCGELSYEDLKEWINKE